MQKIYVITAQVLDCTADSGDTWVVTAFKDEGTAEMAVGVLEASAKIALENGTLVSPYDPKLRDAIKGLNKLTRVVVYTKTEIELR